MRLIPFILLLVLAASFALAQEDVHIVMFYGQGCPHCAAAHSYLEELASGSPGIDVMEYEIYSDAENRALFENMAQAYGGEIGGVPTIFVGDRMITGFDPVSIDEAVSECMEKDCGNPMDRIGGVSGLKGRLTIPAVISAAAVDAINPCAFAVLIILATTILASGSRKRALLAGFMFTVSIFISYFLMGLGLYSAIVATGLSRGFFIAVSIAAISLGLFNLKDYLWYGRWFVMEVPLSWRPKLKSLLKGVTSVPGAFLIGFLVSLFLLPCTSGPYIVILGLLAEVATRDKAVALLVLYNLIFILPMIAITLAVYYGFTTTERAEKWRTSRLEVLHLIAGVLLLLLGSGMLMAIGYGLM